MKLQILIALILGFWSTLIASKPLIVQNSRFKDFGKVQHKESRHETSPQKKPEHKITKSPPFKILISLSADISTSKSPSSLSSQPLYLLSNGSTTAEISLAASCHHTATSRLYCGNRQTPIGSPATRSGEDESVVMSLLSGIRESEERSKYDIGKMVHGGWTIEGAEYEKKLKWKRKDMKEQAKFILKDEEEGNVGGTVWAAFGGVSKHKTVAQQVEVVLKAVFD